MVLSILFITAILPKQARFKYEFEKGIVWMHDDLISPYNFAIRKTTQEIKSDKDNILKSILPVYRLDEKVLEVQLSEYQADFEAKWRSAGLPDDDYKERTFEFGFELLKNIYQKGVIGLNKNYQKEKDNANYLIMLLKNNVKTEVSTATLLTTTSAFSLASERVVENKKVRTDILVNVLKDRITPNILLDERFTESLQKQAIENVSSTRGMVQKGEVIIENGSTINDEVYQKLESLRLAYEENARVTGDRNLVLLGQFLLVALIVSLLMVFLYLFRKDIFQDNRQISLILMVVTGMLLFLSWSIKVKLPSLYYIPYCIVPIIIRILFDTRLAMNIHLLVVLIASFFVPNSFEFAFLQISAGMVSIYSIKNLVRREQFLISALLILLTYFISYLGISLSM